jgi:hypothetical protein
MSNSRIRKGDFFNQNSIFWSYFGTLEQRLGIGIALFDNK